MDRKLLVLALRQVISKQLYNITNNELKEALYKWVQKWQPTKLIKLYKKQPDVFEPLPKGPSSDLYRILAIKPEVLDGWISGKMFKCKRPIESWSTTEKIHGEFAKTQDEISREDAAHLILLKRKIPVEERLAFIPEIDLGFDKHDFGNEGEVITLCQSITVNDIYRIAPLKQYYDRNKYKKIKKQHKSTYKDFIMFKDFLSIRKEPLTLSQAKQLAIETFNKTKPTDLDIVVLHHPVDSSLTDWSISDISHEGFRLIHSGDYNPLKGEGIYYYEKGQWKAENFK